MLRELLVSYPQVIMALQVRSSFVGDLVLSDEMKDLIPRLNPSDAYRLPLFVSIPSRNDICNVIKESAQAIRHTDPLRPVDTPKAEDTAGDQGKAR